MSKPPLSFYVFLSFCCCCAGQGFRCHKSWRHRCYFFLIGVRRLHLELTQGRGHVNSSKSPACRTQLISSAGRVPYTNYSKRPAVER
ncbi:hypothetical protein HDV62DRAFT_365292 [Trichoderma sp. SZMC 28011]